MSRTPPTYEVNIRDLRGRPGETREKTLDLPAIEHLGEGLVAVPQGEPVHVDVRLEAVHEGILATGEVDTRAVGICARCGADLALPVRVDFQDLFAYPADAPFDLEVRGDHVDLEPLIRDAVVLSLPFQPECIGGCEEIDLAPGITVVLGGEPSEAPVDERWAALARFVAQDGPREPEADEAAPQIDRTTD